MRIKCRCGSLLLVIRSERQKRATFLSCPCTNYECRLSFVTTLGFKHSIFFQNVDLPDAYGLGHRIYCGCNSLAVIYKTLEATLGLARGASTNTRSSWIFDSSVWCSTFYV